MNQQRNVRVTPALADRAVGAVLASAVGDALGAPYEFGAPSPRATCAMEGGGSFGWEPGEWTDDTQMALAVLTVLATGSRDVDEMGAAMVRWFESRPRDVGNQTRAVLGAASRDSTSPRLAALDLQKRSPNAAGNGALMRTGPVALAAIGDRDEVARLAGAVAELTHPHADSVDACVLWSLAIERAITTASPDADFNWIGALLGGLEYVAGERRTLWRERIEAAAGADPSTFSANNGWVVGAFQAAVAAITSTADDEYRFPCDHLAASLRAAARAGGDTDTVAAIVGSLAGARWGATGIPLVWRRPLHGRITYARSPIGAARLDALARLALGGGLPDASGWPGVAQLDYGPMTPVHIELDGAWFGNVAGRDEALRDGATIVVSLCRTGSGEIPAGIEHHTIGLIDTGADDNPNGAFVLHDTARTIADLVDAGERVYVHCARAEHRAPSMAAAYLIARGADASAAIDRASAATGGAPSPYLRDQLLRIAGAQQDPRLPR